MGGPDYTRTERSRRWRARKKRGFKVIGIRVTRADEVKLAAAEIPATRDGTV